MVYGVDGSWGFCCLLLLLLSSLDKVVAVAELAMGMVEDTADTVIPWMRPLSSSWPRRWLLPQSRPTPRPWSWPRVWPTPPQWHQRKLGVATVEDQAGTTQHWAGNTLAD